MHIKYFLLNFTDFFLYFQGSFGTGCNSICRCENGGSCDPIDGSCTCPPGVEGQFCEDGCPAGLFGESCDQSCPQQCPSGRCNRDFGFCECAAGYFGISCNLPCPENTFGRNCAQTCNCDRKYTTGCDAAVSQTNTVFNYLSTVISRASAPCKSWLISG